MLNKLQQWLTAEVNSKILAEAPYGSYAELIDELEAALKESALPPAVEAAVRAEAAKAVAALISIRLKKILWDVQQGRSPQRLLAEEERLIAPIRRMLEAQAKPSARYVVVVFLDKFPAMSTSEFKQIGPFNKGDLAKLPAEDARDLEVKGIVKRLSLMP
ncbi:MAG: DNA replication initiation complex subunit [Thermoproteus sp. AZ2]|uniref:DNA replication initiation complex subunit n=1 Tax=Thermoproteus sp. AZ2 TaxID=1609232 RepID=A0ACC6UYR8_9CREN|nr:MAG: DNA replication initiation complex subunit [Thermoproteus sp. AZ2]